MTGARFIQIGLALCLVASMLIASPSACACSHNNDEAIRSDECRAHQESADNIDGGDGGIAIDDSCVCAVDQRTPSVSTKFETKDLRFKGDLANAARLISDLEPVAASTVRRSPLEFANELSSLSSLRSILPARAPPRL